MPDGFLESLYGFITFIDEFLFAGSSSASKLLFYLGVSSGFLTDFLDGYLCLGVISLSNES